MDLPNVQNIQVLKGPQGTLYGRNATGGAILIDTIDPGASWEGNVEATYGRFEDMRFRGYVAGPVTDRVGLSVAGTYRETDGYYNVASRTTPGEFDGHGLPLKQESIRAKLKFDVTDTFRAALGYNYMRASDPRGVFFTSTENVSTPYTGANATRPRGLGEVAGDAFELDLKQHEGSLKLELDTGIGTLSFDHRLYLRRACAPPTMPTAAIPPAPIRTRSSRTEPGRKRSTSRSTRSTSST